MKFGCHVNHCDRFGDPRLTNGGTLGSGWRAGLGAVSGKSAVVPGVWGRGEPWFDSKETSEFMSADRKAQRGSKAAACRVADSAARRSRCRVAVET